MNPFVMAVLVLLCLIATTLAVGTVFYLLKVLKGVKRISSEPSNILPVILMTTGLIISIQLAFLSLPSLFSAKQEESPRDVSSAVSEPVSDISSVSYNASLEDISEMVVDDNIKNILEQNAKKIINKQLPDLENGFQVIDTATGDLNSDSLSDLAVVVEKSPGITTGQRAVFVLTQDNDTNYKIKHYNNKAVLGSKEGGAWGGDPFESVKISGGKLIINHYRGSAFRDIMSDTFQYFNNEFILAESQRNHYYTGTGNGEKRNYDYLKNNVEIRSYSEIDKKFQEKLIYKDKFPGGKISFEQFSVAEEEPDFLLPSLRWYHYEFIKPYNTKITANQALDKVKNLFASSMEKADIPWTPETKANFSSLLHYTAPDYYYKKGDSVLYYFELNGTDEEGYKHTVISYDGAGNSKFYRIDDVTGEITQY